MTPTAYVGMGIDPTGLGSSVVMISSLPLATVERIITSEPWYVTAGVALVAALAGSVVGSFSTYRLNVVLDNRSREGRAEIRRKQKVYTPIRAEMLALRAAMERDEHIGYFQGILRADRGYRTRAQPPELYAWRTRVKDGRAMSSASGHVRKSLDALEYAVDAFNEVLQETGEVFQRCGDAIVADLNIGTGVTNWAQSEAVNLVRHQFDQLFSGPAMPQLAGSNLQLFWHKWDSDSEIKAASVRLSEAESKLRMSLDAAIAEVEAAMRRIAKKHESEPED